MVVGLFLLGTAGENNMATYFSRILPSQEVAEKMLKQYQAKVEAEAGTIAIQTMKKVEETTNVKVTEKTEQGETTEKVEKQEAVDTLKGPALYVTLPDGVDISTVLPDAEEIVFTKLA